MRENVKSFVTLKHKRPCRLKDHFNGCLREVVGYLDKMASKDPARFVWANEIPTTKNWKTKQTYGERQISRSLAMAEMLGITKPAFMNRCGERAGYVVAPHDRVTQILDGKFCILSAQNDKSLASPPRPRHKKRHTRGSDMTSHLTSENDDTTSKSSHLTSHLTSETSQYDITSDITDTTQVSESQTTYPDSKGELDSGFEGPSLIEPFLTSKESLLEPDSEKQNPEFPLSSFESNPTPKPCGQEELNNLLGELVWITDGEKGPVTFNGKCQKQIARILSVYTAEQIMEQWRDFWDEACEGSLSWCSSAPSRFCKQLLLNTEIVQ